MGFRTKINRSDYCASPWSKLLVFALVLILLFPSYIPLLHHDHDSSQPSTEETDKECWTDHDESAHKFVEDEARCHFCEWMSSIDYHLKFYFEETLLISHRLPAFSFKEKIHCDLISMGLIEVAKRGPPTF